MFNIKRKGREEAAKIHDNINSSLLRLSEKLNRRYSLQARCRLFICRAKRNPKKVLAYYALYLVIITLINLYWIAYRPGINNQDPLNLTEISSVDDGFAGMSLINSNRVAIHSEMTQIAEATIALSDRLDSLLKLDHLSRKDSLEIIQIYQKLNIHKSNSHP